MKRRGFALLSAILIAAFMLAVVTGIGATLISQVRSQAQAGVSKKAFYYAETALQDSFSAACNPADSTGIRAYLLAASQSSLAWNKNGAYAVPVAGDARAFTWVKAKKIFDSGNKFLRYSFVAEGVVCDRSNLTRALFVAGTGFNVVARRVIELGAGGLSAGDAGSIFNFGVFSGSGMVQKGLATYNAPLGPVTIYAGTEIDLNNTTLGPGITAIAHDTVDVKDWTIPPEEHGRQLVAPPIDLAYWQSQFVAFLNGTTPYDGTIPSGSTVAQYMDTHIDAVRTAIQYYLTGKPVSVSGYSGYQYTTPLEVANLYAALAPATPTGKFATLTTSQYKDVKDTFFRTVFYVQDSAGSLNATIPDHPYSGVLVCPGTLGFDSKSVIDPPPSGAVFMSKGDLTFNGAGKFQGTFYTEGNFIHTGNTEDFYGSIIALKGNVGLNGGGGQTFNLVNYAANDTELAMHFQAIETIGTGWSEADYLAFTGF